MTRSLSAVALERVRKFSDTILGAVVSNTTNRPQPAKDDSFFDYGSRSRKPRKSKEPNLKRSPSRRNICKDGIRPYLRINPSKSTNDLLVGGGKKKDDVEPPRSRFSANTEDPVEQAPRGRKTEKKGLAKAKIQPPQRPPRPADQDFLEDVYGELNVVGLAPPPAREVKEQLREERGRQENMGLAAADATTARPGEDMRHRGSTTETHEALARRVHDGRLHHKVQADDEVGPPVPPKDYTPAKMSSPFSTMPSRSRLRVGPGAALTRNLSTNSAPDGTVGVSRVVPMSSRPTTLDERRQPLNMDELTLALTGQMGAPRPTGSSPLYRSSSLGNTNTQASTRPLQHPHPRPLDGRGHRTARPDENEPRPGRAEYRPYKPSPLRTRQPSVVPLSSRTDAYLPEPRHKPRPSEMDLPRDVFSEDSEQSRTVRRRPEQVYATVYAPATARAPATVRARELKNPLPPSPVPSTRMTAKMHGTVRVKEVPRPIQMSMTITTPSPKFPDSYENDVVVIAPFSPATSLVSTVASIGDFHEEGLIQQLMTRTDDPRMNRRDTYTRGQLQLALGEMERVRPLSIHKKRSSKQPTGRWQ
ncbi:hypothetical protein GSI_03941 [Ganoderma sinense ZZ0214-1]|uniref:Uncharacterized protein n=1 Tax=Ganoderma sinense ZZ0214-1 TaxID=1077348 RepID=A0A2G8SKF2_9APHY|nr:hypothetical protein GSI_03941 [Ganoderma sinense ZZ0214-1]